MSGLTTIHRASQEAGSATRLLFERRVVYCQHIKALKTASAWLLWRLDMSSMSEGFIFT